MINVDEIKQRINCVDYLQMFMSIFVESGKRCVSPLRNGAKNPTSFYVTEDFFFDFGLAQGGDVIDLCAMHKFDGNRGRAIYFLAEKLNIKANNYDPKAEEKWIDYTNSLNNKIARWHSKLTQQDIDYLHSRGISDETIERYRIGRTPDGRLSLPYYKNGYCCYYATRAMPNCKNADKKYMKMPIDEYNEHIVFGLDTITDDRSLMCIAEGMFDCLSFVDAGYSCISAITGHFSANQLKTVLPLLKTYKKVLIVYDNDLRTHAGEKFTYKMANILAKNQIPFVVGQVPTSYKDISEMYADPTYYRAGIKNLINDAQEGLNFLARQLNEEDFCDFMLTVTKGMSKTQIMIIFDKLINDGHIKINKQFIRKVEKMCTAPPKEEDIAVEICEEHHILFNPAIGHFVWNGKQWQKQLPEQIMQFAVKKLGDSATASRVKSVLKLIEVKTVTDRVFNTEPVLNFQNGTLELVGDFNFRNHSMDDMCSYTLKYNYDPHAECEEWERFIDSITAYDTRKSSCLQEFMGYILYPNNEMQRALCCIGGGSNGKSVLLNVMSLVYGKENISNVEMSAFAQDFQRIKLMDSMLNISSETRSNVAQAESYFKSVVAGDTCSACYKGKDYVEFIPRAKIIMACNEYLKPNDTSNGFLRRLLFVRFPVKFCDDPNPDNELEQPIDRTLEAKFSKPEYLSGIMNWVISGYRQLKSVGEFTKADDTQEIVEEFTALTNPVIDFLAEFVMPVQYGTGFKRVTNTEIYERYTAWCINSGHKPSSRRRFIMQVNSLLQEYRPDIKPYRTTTERGFECKD